MGPLPVRRCLPFLVACVACAASVPAFGDAAQSEEDRKEFQSFYSDQKRANASFFASAPSHHVTPKRDNISFSLQVDLVDVAIGPNTANLPDDFATLDHRLEMTGFSAFPLIAFAAD